MAGRQIPAGAVAPMSPMFHSWSSGSQLLHHLLQPALHLQVILTLPHFIYFETVNGGKGKKNTLFYVGLPSLAD